MTDEQTFPPTGRLAGVDFGTVRIGVAICDPGRSLVSPLDVVQRSTERVEAETFRALAQREGIAGWIVGLPVHSDGKESQSSGDARRFARWLGEQTELPVRLFDERFTSQAADRRLRETGKKAAARRRRVDAVAAQVLLEGFLEADRRQPGTAGVPPGPVRLDIEPLDDRLG